MTDVMTSNSGCYTTMSGNAPDFREKYLQRHYITEMPESLKKVKDVRFGLAQLEAQLHLKMSQFVARSSDRYCELSHILKNKAPRRDVHDDQSLRVYREDFQALLTHLSIFAQKEAANALFDKYDQEGYGFIPMSKFIIRSRPKDFGPTQFFTPVFPNKPVKQGQKLFPDRANYGVPVQASIPSNNVYTLTANKMCKGVAAKMQQHSQIGKTNSAPRARRILAREFEFYDRLRCGYVNKNLLVNVLTKINYQVEDPQINMLMKKFPGPTDDAFDYVKFIQRVYPDPKDEPRTSLKMGREHGAALWDFMHSIDADGDGTVSLDEMLAFKRSLGPINTPPPRTPATPGSPINNSMSQMASLTTRRAVVSRPASRQMMTVHPNEPDPRPPSGYRPMTGNRPPTGSMTARLPSRSGSRGGSRVSGSMTQRAPPSRGGGGGGPSARPPSSGSRTARVVSRPGSRAISRPGSRAVSRGQEPDMYS